MDSIISSLQVVATCAITILAIAACCVCIWLACGFSGYPVADWIARRIPDLDGRTGHLSPNEITTFGAFVGMMLCMVLLLIHVANSVTSSGTPGHDAATTQDSVLPGWLWFFGTVLQAGFEGTLVMAFFSGLVKVVQYDWRRGAADVSKRLLGGRETPVDVEMEDGSPA